MRHCCLYTPNNTAQVEQQQREDPKMFVWLHAAEGQAEEKELQTEPEKNKQENNYNNNNKNKKIIINNNNNNSKQ